MALPMASESSELPPSRAALAGPPSFIDGAPPSLAPLPEPLAPADKPAGWYAKFKQAVKALKREVLALHYAIQDPRVGWLPRLVALMALAYALSPLDLIPDFIPVLGLIDDLLLLPALLLLARALIPADILEAGRRRAEDEPLRLHKNWGMALFVLLIWDALLLALAYWACARFGGTAPLQQHKAWIVGGTGALLVLCEGVWAVHQWRREQRLGDVLRAAGGEAQPELQEALLAGGSAAVQAYLEP